MATITKGSCVGVLYRNAANNLAVHNGKLLSPAPINTAKLPATVRIVHYTKVPNPKKQKNHKYLMKRQILKLKPVKMRKTPNANPTTCKNNPRKPGLIEPGACIAMRFIEKGVEDVKNGKFLFALVNKQITCYIDPKKPPKTIVYEHLNLVNGKFQPQQVVRTGVQEVRRIVIKPGEK